MNRFWLLGLACLVCCLPLIVPFLGAAGLTGAGAWLGGLGWAEIACLALLVGAIAVAGLVFLRRRRASGPYCDVKD